MIDLEYDVIIVTVENSLVHTKSGSNFPKNIADFMPDYNLWYALKFCSFKNLWVVENQDLTGYGWNYMSSGEHDARYSFIKIWLTQMIGHNRLNSHHLYSIRGNWRPGWSRDNEGETILDFIKKREKNSKKILFIDKDTEESKEFIKDFEYTTVSEFIKKYNKNPRVYEKKM